MTTGAGGDGERGEGLRRLLFDNMILLSRAPRRAVSKQSGPANSEGNRGGRNVLGKIWNAPNTLLGLGYGAVGHLAGEALHAVNPKHPRPKIDLGENAVQFRNNPLGGVSAITIGNTSTYSEDFGSPDDQQHEKQHTYQGEQLGPLYLPSNLLGGLNALTHGEDWHGPHNWNERGPQETPPRAWALRKR